MDIREKLQNIDPERLQMVLKNTIRYLTYRINSNNFENGYEWRECCGQEKDLDDIYIELFGESAILPPPDVSGNEMFVIE